MVAFSEKDSACVVRSHASHFDITLFHADRTFDISAGGLEATPKLQSMILQIVTFRFHQVSLAEA